MRTVPMSQVFANTVSKDEQEKHQSNAQHPIAERSTLRRGEKLTARQREREKYNDE